jgi:hypothetical protein
VTEKKTDPVKELLDRVRDLPGDAEVTVRAGDLRKLWNDYDLLVEAVNRGWAEF